VSSGSAAVAGPGASSADRGLVRKAGLTAAVVVAAAIALWAIDTARVPATMLGVVVAPRNAGLTVRNQSSAAGHLVVDRVLAPDDSWVVVTSASKGGADATVVGLARVPAGESRNVDVSLAPGLEMNQGLVVTVHADRGVRGRFEFAASRFEASPDKPYFSAGVALSAPIRKDLTLKTLAQAGLAASADEVAVSPGEAVLDVADRLTVIDTLVVDRVVAPGPSWVVVYLVDDTGAPGEVAGVVPVAAGETMGVSVPISTASGLTGKVLVALQADRGTAGAFEFDAADPGAGPDKPYAIGGTELSRPVLLRGYGMSNDNMIDSGAGGM
jgi:hypothetical protein